VPLLELIVRNIARYPQSATSTPIRYQPAIRYLLPWLYYGMFSVALALVAASAEEPDQMPKEKLVF
jgi:hypothetical protein